jgi:hypothetical protein
MIPIPNEFERRCISFWKSGSVSIFEQTKYPSFAQLELETAWKKLWRKLEKPS